MFLSNPGSPISEPMTMATDYILATQALIHALTLRSKAAGNPSTTVRRWIQGFYAAAFGALAGGTAHGFQLILAGFLLKIVILATVVGVGVAVFRMLGSAIESAKRPDTVDALRLKTGAHWLRGMAGAAALAMLIALFGPSLHEHFNHYDLSHIVLMFGLYSGYRGAILRHDLGC